MSLRTSGQNFGQAIQIPENKHFGGPDMPRGRPRNNFGLENFRLIFCSLHGGPTGHLVLILLDAQEAQELRFPEEPRANPSRTSSPPAPGPLPQTWFGPDSGLMSTWSGCEIPKQFLRLETFIACADADVENMLCARQNCAKLVRVAVPTGARKFVRKMCGAIQILKTREKRVYTTTVAPLLFGWVARPQGHRAKMLWCILETHGKRVYTIGPGRRVYIMEASDPEKERKN